MPASQVLLVAPTSHPVTLEDVRGHVRNASTKENPFIESILIPAATMYAEAVQKRQLMPATWRLTLDRFPAWGLSLPTPPLLSIEEVAYVDTAGASQVLASSEYQVDTDAEPGRLAPAYGKTWPSTRGETLGAVKIKFKAGYGTTDAAARAAIPANTKLGILNVAAYWFDHRPDMEVGLLPDDVHRAVAMLLRADYCEPADCEEGVLEYVS